MTFSSLRPFLDYPVSPEWIFNLIQAEKLTYDSARSELIKCGKGLTRRLADLDRWHRCKLEEQQKTRALQVQSRLRAKMQSFRCQPVVEEWQLEVSQLDMGRKRMLVLDGRSGTGKSAFARSLFAIGQVMELNCAGLQHVCLGSFDSTRHKCIFWDEIGTKLGLRNINMFQHPAAWVDLGHSPTGQHVHHLWLNDSCSMLASNHWREDIKGLSSESDKEWLEANTVVLVVSEVLWE